MFTGVAQEMGKGGAEDARYTFFLTPLDLGGQHWAIPASPTPPPPALRRDNLSLSVPLVQGSGPLWLPHPFTDSSFLPRQLPRPPPLPLAPLQHNGLAAFRFHDTLTPSLPVLQCIPSQTHRPRAQSHSLDTQSPTASHSPDSLQSRCLQNYFLQTGARSLGRRPGGCWGWGWGEG